LKLVAKRKALFTKHADVRIRVVSPARIHCGLLNTSGYAQRIDGGVGFSIKSPSWIVDAEKGPPAVHGLVSTELQNAADEAFSTLTRVLGLHPFRVTIRRSIPLHAGLGAKTSFLMAIARAGCLLSDVYIPYLELARLLQRGGTSGIGVHSFAKGGFIWDGGHAFPGDKSEMGPSSQFSAQPPRLITRISAEWLTLIHFRYYEQGLSGADERAAFRENCPTSHDDTRANVISVGSFIVPGLMEENEELLQCGLKRLQYHGFKQVEWKYQGPMTRRFQEFWQTTGLTESVGISSFGPTLYVLTRSPEKVVAAIRAFGTSPLSITSTQINNVGYQFRRYINASS
jgi:beta-ribofuranosylaminobenzene 5'-phosphate synthase